MPGNLPERHGAIPFFAFFASSRESRPTSASRRTAPCSFDLLPCWVRQRRLLSISASGCGVARDYVLKGARRGRGPAHTLGGERGRSGISRPWKGHLEGHRQTDRRRSVALPGCSGLPGLGGGDLQQPRHRVAAGGRSVLPAPLDRRNRLEAGTRCRRAPARKGRWQSLTRGADHRPQAWDRTHACRTTPTMLGVVSVRQLWLSY